jgi:aspartate carbamoyltransferase catalytic subunit
MKSLISVRDLSRDEVIGIINIAKDFKKGKTARMGGDVALLFLEPSTRTRISFEKAIRNLGMTPYVVSDSGSSMVKGESFQDTVHTFRHLGFKGVVFRVPFTLFPYEELVKGAELSLINAGDSSHQHPTQGLIDLYTLLEKFGDIEGLKVLFVGDILYSRVFRSTAPLLRMFGAKVGICGPRTLIPRDVHVFEVEKVFDEVDEGIDWADVVVWLRLQKERQKDNLIPSDRSYFLQFGLTKERYGKLKGYFMHPGPVNRNIDIDGELIYSDKSLIARQVENGLYVRMAVLKWCFE